ncbi:unnamed protein product [Peronospora belbahrii]|uniref:Uncharacterized protein n=1 Tax=Peronospora belbahrii TaxID=622444 RepID=A0AAU9KW17_9STRA|nr:unnamed protein product [Peronospora belbahrii]CAH0520353.1 unnamed protein product [Peronospora belbahrii]
MEANAQYALHDSDATPPTWAARIRLTPELLDKLRQVPEKARLQLNVSNNDGLLQCRGSNKKTSLMTIKVAESEEKYELLSFIEDSSINHVCTFRRSVDNESFGGYSIYKTGEIYQKLLVQRLLDDTEKDRIKDKHAQSVIASKSRCSQLIESNVERSAKRQRLVTRSLSVRTSKTSAGSSAWSKATGHKRIKKLVLPSALTKEEAIEAKERVEKGIDVDKEMPVVAVEETRYAYDVQERKEVKDTAVVISQQTAAARDAEIHALFSSDSDHEDGENSQGKELQQPKKRTATEKDLNRSAVVAIEKDSSENKALSEAENTEVTAAVLDTTMVIKKPSSVLSGCDAAVEVIRSIKNDDNVTQDKKSGGAMDIYALKPTKPSTFFGVEVKRARVRSALVFDRVKQSQLPNLSFFPSAVVEICQRVSGYHGRSVILDESDYNSFIQINQHFREDWEMLDKAYSIEMIKTEGLHLQLEMDILDTNHEELKARIEASYSKKEGLLFVRDAMASIQKILCSIQTSINRFDSKPLIRKK